MSERISERERGGGEEKRERERGREEREGEGERHLPSLSLLPNLLKPPPPKPVKYKQSLPDNNTVHISRLASNNNTH